ncbi:DUF6344 domain-containing protein [Streptomyces sp. HMX87]|uniref:DUF6344 domain-containing protein n=1 Tax=Streptomyces sp. HMX87 TaxID=3390849 RepID=UPI003A844A6F
MARNKVMKLWTAIVTAFLALFTALGLITTTASAAVPQTETTRNSDHDRDSDSDPRSTVQTASSWSWSRAGALPPTMKQRIRAEAHGKSPSCRHRPPTDATAADPAAAHPAAASALCDPDEAPADTPLQR